jgi:hypothetical protein
MERMRATGRKYWGYRISDRGVGSYVAAQAAVFEVLGHSLRVFIVLFISIRAYTRFGAGDQSLDV